MSPISPNCRSRNRYRFRWMRAFVVLAILVVSVTPLTAEPNFQRDSVDDGIEIGYGIVIGEVDGDGAPDILLADKTEIVWYENPGSRDKPWPRHVMARNLTSRDNVCLAARDLDGDGKVEVAVGGNWNPGETDDPAQSGALFYLTRPADATKGWKPVALSPHDPTVHRMHWVRGENNEFRLVVLPLHGRGNRKGEGKPVRVQAYTVAADTGSVQVDTIDESMHMTHNFDVISSEGRAETLLVAGKEGLKWIGPNRSMMFAPQPLSRGAGEVRHLDIADGLHEAAAIEPMHGNEVVMYQQTEGETFRRVVIDTGLNQGHAVAVADLLGLGRHQVVAGWRSPDANNKVGVRLYVPDANGDNWQTHTLDDNQMACEDLRIADLDGDDQLDIIAAGRATKNLVIYWNDSK